MSLRARVVTTLLAITVILAIPAAYGLVQLDALKRITQEMRIRDTGAAQTVGRLRTSLEEYEAAQDNYAVLRPSSPATAFSWRGSTRTAAGRVNQAIVDLRHRQQSSPEYRDALRDMEHEWAELQRLVNEEQARLERGENDPDAVFRGDSVLPAYARINAAVPAITEAINREADQRRARASNLARISRNTTLLALAMALGLTVVIGGLMTRALLRPIQELRRGMSHVAEGDFDPDVHVPTERGDEIGDLARSFSTMTEQLAELDRLKAEFVSVASHEIKTPLSVIRGYVSLLADGIYGAVTDTQKKTLEAVSDQVDRLTRLVHRLLDISRFEAGGGRLELRRINIRDFLAELTDGFRVLAFQNGIDFAVDVADDTPVNIEGDADRLNEVLGNILSNAFKFTESGGRISLDARREGAGLMVAVRDTGVGIPPDKLPKIFEKFYQVDNTAQPRQAGSGLGLAIAREIVEAHGGTITAESGVGKGTVFCVTLPERPPAGEPHALSIRR